MLLSTEEFARFTLDLPEVGHIGFDFETTGLKAYKGARAFIMGFTDTEGKTFCVRLDDPMVGEVMRLFFSKPKLKYCAHNAKFELSFLHVQFGIDPPAVVWDTEVMARIQYNAYQSYALGACAKRIKMSKTMEMDEWLKQPGNKHQYHKAPSEIIEPYVEHDAFLSWELCRQQIEHFRHWDISSPIKTRDVVRLELQTTPWLFDMERKGLLVDVNYCVRALAYEQESMETAKAEFERLASVPFVDSRKTLKPLFDAHGIHYGETALGNASFSDDALEGAKGHPLVGALLRYRRSCKRASAYWSNFLELECNGIIHPNINQNRATTGRMSISEPSCQNWASDNDDPVYPIRRAFVARPDCQIASLDYSQMELRLMCDEANDIEMIEAFKQGRDFHQETADMAGVPRNLAKNGRFAKLYGAGVKRVADTLGVAMDVAKKICSAIDGSSPRVAEYTRELIAYADVTACGYNWLGRRYFFNMDKRGTFRYPNYRIQGGCGEILRFSIIEVGRFLRKEARPETFMLIPIHDEIVFNIHKDDLRLLPEIKRIMIGAHKSKRSLDMDVGVMVGPNFYDLEEIK